MWKHTKKKLNSKTFNISLDNIKEQTSEESIPVGGYVLEQDCYVRFSASFTAANGYCRVRILDEDDNTVFYLQMNSSPTPSNAQSSGIYPCRKGWKITLSGYGNLVTNHPKYVLTY